MAREAGENIEFLIHISMVINIFQSVLNIYSQCSKVNMQWSEQRLLCYTKSFSSSWIYKFIFNLTKLSKYWKIDR